MKGFINLSAIGLLCSLWNVLSVCHLSTSDLQFHLGPVHMNPGQ